MTELLHKELTRQIIGVYYTVYNKLSQTYPEFIYERAMTALLERLGIRCIQQDEYEIRYKDRLVGMQRLDIFIASEVVVELRLRGLEVMPRQELRVFLGGIDLGAIKFGHLQVDNRALLFPVAVSNIESIQIMNLKAWMRYLNIPIAVLVNFRTTRLEPLVLRI